MEKKNLAIIILAIVLAASGIGNIILGIQTGAIEVQAPDLETLIRGTGAGPPDLDPVDSWDSAANDVIRQVAEPLFFYDYRDPLLERANWLADSYSWPTPVTLEINIRTGIKFHDGTYMDAAACAWNFDRLIWLMNHTGEMPGALTRAKIHSLYEFPDGSPVMNRTNVVDADTFQIILNAPYTQILAAMAYVSCDILSPASTPAERFLDKADPLDLLVGTGPYVYEYYTADTEVRFTKNEDYWGTPSGDVFPEFDVLVFDVMDDPSTRNYAILAGDTDYNAGSMADLFENFKESPYITFYEAEDPGLGISYLGINNDVYTIADGDEDDVAIGVNVTWREAITYAINYTYIVHDYWQDQMIRANSWISPGYGAYFDDTLWDDMAPDGGNITHSRKAIFDDLSPVNAEVAGRDINVDADWDITGSASTLVTFNYSYNTDNAFRTDLYPLLKNWLGKIGIFVEDGGTDWAYFIYRAYGYVPGGYDQLQIYWVGWGPDYLDPMNMIQPLISNASTANSAQINDPTIEGWINEYNTNTALTEAQKIALIKQLTHRCSAEIFTHVFGYHAKVFAVHKSDLYNVAYNVVGNWWALPIKRNASWVPGQWYNTA